MATQTLEKLNAPNIDQYTGAVTFPILGDGQTFELKTGILHLLPKFEGTP